MLSVAEQEEDDVVGPHPEHDHHQERSELGSELEVEPVGKVGGEGLGHLVDEADDKDRQHGDEQAAEDDAEQERMSRTVAMVMIFSA